MDNVPGPTHQSREENARLISEEEFVKREGAVVVVEIKFI